MLSNSADESDLNKSGPNIIVAVTVSIIVTIVLGEYIILLI